VGKTESATAWEAIPSKSAAKSSRRPMKTCNEYHFAENIEDALLALSQAGGKATLLAGGTDLLLDIQQGRHEIADTLVDITNIPEMRVLERREDHIFIGAAVTHRTITTSPLINEHAPALTEASGLIGGPQVRNVATLGGNVAHALPAADGTIALIALDSSAEIASPKGFRTMPLIHLFAGPGKNTLDPETEILTGFHLPLKQTRSGSAFKRIMRPQGVAIAILNCAVWLQREGDQIASVRISVGPSGPTPRRMTTSEAALIGKSPTTENIETAYQALLSDASFRTSRHRATLEYRQKMAGVLLRETLQLAWERASE